MKQLTIHSKRYPGLGAPVPQVPGAAPGTKGSFTFFVGEPYVVTDETAKTLIDLINNQMEKRVSRHYQLTVYDIAPSAVPEDAIATPTAPPVKDAIPPAPLVLSDDDRALIGVEVLKLKGLTTVQATPLIENTARNEDLPIEIRRAYLQAVIDSKNAKALDLLAQKLLEEIDSDRQ